MVRIIGGIAKAIGIAILNESSPRARERKSDDDANKSGDIVSEIGGCDRSDLPRISTLDVGFLPLHKVIIVD